METYQDLFFQARGISVSVGASEETFQRVEMPTKIIERIQSVLAGAPGVAHKTATQAYGNAGAQQHDIETAAEAEIRHALTQNAIWGMNDVRGPFNSEAHGYLSGYASSHKEEWKAAAKELGIDIEGGNFLNQFYKEPAESGLDVRIGVPKSQGEQIFRHIASPSEIAEFETRVAPFQADMDQHMTDKIKDVYSELTARLEPFSPFVDDMEAAGLTIEDMLCALIVRNKDGGYSAKTIGENAAAIEDFINNTPEVRALYDREWQKFSSTLDQVEAYPPISSNQFTLTPLILPEAV